MDRTLFRTTGWLLLVTLVLSLSACGATGRAATSAETECPEPTEGNQLSRNDEQGFCFVYPAGFSQMNARPGMTIIHGAAGTEGTMPEPPYVIIDVAEAEASSAIEIVDALASQIQEGRPDAALERSTVTIGGEEAVVLDGVPEVDLIRQLYVVKDGKLYTMTFAPSDATIGDLYTRMEILYRTVVNSFVFLPSS